MNLLSALVSAVASAKSLIAPTMTDENAIMFGFRAGWTFLCYTITLYFVPGTINSYLTMRQAKKNPSISLNEKEYLVTRFLFQLGYLLMVFGLALGLTLLTGEALADGADHHTWRQNALTFSTSLPPNLVIVAGIIIQIVAFERRRRQINNNHKKETFPMLKVLLFSSLGIALLGVWFAYNFIN